jgi:hypothetical protein
MCLEWSHHPLGGGAWGANCETGHLAGFLRLKGGVRRKNIDLLSTK